ncbi:single-stranded-DNA-specific exonuclease RecJ [Cytobacillus kochii]|uniref:single-stranded-DNA-specific exonuclease RecJ n=1 Tax=Cytobacillus kochii TaxID=859143 RepID=UPI001CD769D1|nr:single-stranded-DNA-specific exonuclease RecJ [Cytobacillus kochii]MCA1025353.1 single-stranded-DNA-specific exonuclease RecJ [Cytobacillus kochii]
MLHSKTRWNVRQSDEASVEELINGLNISSALATLLVNRGFNTVESARYFLFDEKKEFHDPFLLKDMDLAVSRIQRAIKNNESIMIFGDYDADGVTSTTVMMRTLTSLGADVQFYIPNRFTEGYGPNVPAFQYASDIGVSLIITVDTGIAAIEPAQAAKEMGIDLIITDHHEPGPILPECLAIIHPKLPDSRYPFKELAGVGVAFKLAHALLGNVPNDLLEFVAIGTVADLVSLTDENRLIVKKGLKKLQSTQNLGIRSLISLANVKLAEMTEETIGFTIAPRLNAVGRLDSADPAVELLLTEDALEAEALAEEIDQMNKERQSIVHTMAEEAIQQVEAEYPIEDNQVIVVGKEGWNPGVVGIVASRLVEKYYRPVICLSFDSQQGIAKGSARSITGFDLFHNLSQSRDILPHFGGHPMAAGMTLKLDDVDILRQRLIQLAKEQLNEDDFIPITDLDAELRVADVNLEMIAEIQQLAPFGIDNPKPKVMLKEANVSLLKRIGTNKTHLKITLEDNDVTLDGIGFGFGEYAEQISMDASLAIVGELSINEWNNIKKPQVFIQDIRIQEWQLFDIRGAKRLDTIVTHVHHQTSEWIVFNKENYDKFLPYNPNVSLILSDEEAENIILDGKHVVFCDLPPQKERIEAILRGKSPERIYCHFYQTNDIFSMATPNRDHFKWYYALIAKRGPFNLEERKAEVAKFKGWQVSYIDFMTEVFFELEFVKIDNGMISLSDAKQKRDLSESQAFCIKQQQVKLENELLYSKAGQLKDWFDGLLQNAYVN